MIKVFNTSEKLPKDNTYVLVHYNGGNHIDSDDQQGVEWSVKKFTRGLSIDERAKLAGNNPKKINYSHSDQHGNNSVPYTWGWMFGQDVDMWAELPKESETK